MIDQLACPDVYGGISFTAGDLPPRRGRNTPSQYNNQLYAVGDNH